MKSPRLNEVYQNLSRRCSETAASYGMKGNLVAGANIVGFSKVADAMPGQGLCV